MLKPTDLMSITQLAEILYANFNVLDITITSFDRHCFTLVQNLV